MKKIFYIIFSLLIIVSSNKIFSQEYYHPESAIYDAARSRYIITNHGSGVILTLDESGQLAIFQEGLTNPRGTCIIDNTLYVVDNIFLKSFNLEDGSSLMEFEVPDSQLLNDIATDGEGNLFLTDTRTNMVYVYTISDQSIIDVPLGMNIVPNGIIYENNHIYVVTYSSPVGILDIDLENVQITKYYYSGHNYGDGITSDGNGSIYFSVWEDMGSPLNKGNIFKVNKANLNEYSLFMSGFSGPADIYYNTVKHELAVPNFASDTVMFIPIQTDVYENSTNNDLFTVFFNQNNSELTVKLRNELNAVSDIKLYNIFGQLIDVNSINSNQKEIVLNCGKLNDGIYFVKINNKISKFIITK